VYPAITGIEATSYRGAFGPSDTWANGWTTISKLGFLATNTVVPPPAAPTMTTTAGSGTVTFSITSQSGYSYQLQATPVLAPPAWTNIGPALPGNGGTLSFPPVVSTNVQEFFRILAQ
jgi:hypothetical protein